MNNVLFQFGELDTSTLVEGEPIWIEALQAKTIHDTPWGDVTIDEAKLGRMATGIKNNIRGIELATDYEHGRDPAKGRKASGYIRDAKVENGSLHVAVEPTPVALSELRNKEWRYFSLDWEDQWKSNENGVLYQDVVMGGAFTNRPIAKGMMPINFSEIMGLSDGTAIQFAEWSTAYKDSLPDSSFLYVSGKTRKFPVKDKDGKVDMPHVRNAISRIPDADVPDGVKAGLQAKARAMLGAHTMSEAMLVDPSLVDVLADMDIDDFINEVLEKKEGDPGMTDEEKAALDKANAEIESLRKLFNIPADGDLVATVTAEHKEFSELTAAAAKHSTAKKFSEEYPDEFRRMQMMEDHTRTTEAKLFSEQLSSRRVVRKEGTGDDAKDVPTNFGLSALALEKAESTHKKFSEGTATIEDFTGFVDTVFAGGMLEYGERGTQQGGNQGTEGDVVPTNVVSIRRQFSEFVDEVSKREGVKDYREAYAIASKEKPNMFKAYQTSNPVVDESAAV